jgi:hypothetical protein
MEAIMILSFAAIVTHIKKIRCQQGIHEWIPTSFHDIAIIDGKSCRWCFKKKED